MDKLITISNRFTYQEITPTDHPRVSFAKGNDKLLKRSVDIFFLLDNQPDSPLDQEHFQVVMTRLAAVAAARVVQIVPVCDMVRSNKLKNILVCEAAYLTTLRKMLDQNSFLRQKHILCLIKPAIRALEALSTKALCHGSICPQNILLWNNGTSKLGFNKLFKPKINYIAPQHLTSHSRSVEGDVFSIGVVLHECILGVYPFIADQPSIMTDKVYQKLYNYQYKVSQQNPFRILVSQQLRHLINEMLAFDPKQRPTPQQLLNSLLFSYVDDSRILGSDFINKKVVQVLGTRQSVISPILKQEQTMCYHIKEERVCILRSIEQSYYDAQFDQLDTHKEKLVIAKNYQTPSLLTVVEYENSGQIQLVVNNYYNQHSLLDYLNSRTQPCNQSEANYYMNNILSRLAPLRQLLKDHRSLTARHIYLHNAQFYFAQPLLLGKKLKDKIRESLEGMEFAPEVVLGGKTLLCDSWSLGFLYYQLLFSGLPEFSVSKQLVIPQKSYLSINANEFLVSALQHQPSLRPKVSELRVGSYDDSWDRRANEQLYEREVQSSRQAFSSFNFKYYFGQEGFNEYFGSLHKQYRTERRIVKGLVVGLIFLLGFFWVFWQGVGSTLFNYGYMQPITLPTSKNSGTMFYKLTLLTENKTSFYKQYNRKSFEYFMTKLNCLESPFSVNSTSQLDFYTNSSGVVLLAVLAILITLALTACKVYQVVQLDMVSCINLRKSKNTDFQHQHFFPVLYEINQAFLLFYHFYLFQFYYSIQFGACLGMRPSGLTPLHFDSYSLILDGKLDSFASRVITCAFLPFLLLALFHGFLLKTPETFTRYGSNSLLLLIPHLVLFVLSRVGFGPASVLQPSLTSGFRREVMGNWWSVMGFFPQIPIIALTLLEWGLDLIFYGVIVCTRKPKEPIQSSMERIRFQLQSKLQ